MFKASVITLYPEMFPGGLGISLAGNALTRGDWELETIPLREFGEGKHRRVDDTPAGGGAGMVLRADVLANAIDSIGEDTRPRLLMSPRGIPLTQSRVRELAAGDGAVIVCGRFEGIDQRVIEARNLEEVSIGDYILSGGEPAALVLLDSIVRLLPGVMGNDSSGTHESFENNLLEHPQYTRPQDWEGQTIPAVLTGGNHKKIAEWQLAEAEKLTTERRPDLISETNELTDIEQATLLELEEQLWIAEYRYDDGFMDNILAQDFVEFGKSGNTYTRENMFFGGYTGQKINCSLPLGNIKIRKLGRETFLVTYLSIQKKDGLEIPANRSSVWHKDREAGWQLKFHQGTAVNGEPLSGEKQSVLLTDLSTTGTSRAIMPALPAMISMRASRFIATNSGFQCVYQDPGGYAVMTWGSVELHLWLANDESWKTRKNGKPINSGAESFLAGTHSCRILVTGVSDLYEKFCTLDIIHPNAKLEKKPWGSTEFGILDPYGNLVIYHEWL